MSSSIFFKFRSQKEPLQISFDGTSLSVFEVKRDIIAINKLGDGKDFDLHIYAADTNEEYDDDTVQIPRSTTVIVSRKPAMKAGAGRAARYVTGSMPVQAKNQHRVESMGNAGKSAPIVKGPSKPAAEMSEEEALKAAMFEGEQQWKEDQAQIAKAPVMRSTFNNNKSAAVPDKPLPPGYTCHRCGEKGHWIQACPTNNDPTFDGRPKFRRTTGIPRSFLKVVEKPTGVGEDGKVDVSKLPPGVMYTTNGEWVISEPDKASWEKFQEKNKVFAEQVKEAQKGDQEVRERGLECSIDHRLFVNPHKTPCCGMTYCFDCIDNALINSDFSCPNCGEKALLDDLKPDEEMAQRVAEYEEEKKGEKKQKDREASKSPAATTPAAAETKSPAPSIPAVTVNGTGSAPSTPGSTKSNPRKRSADEDLENSRKPVGPAAMQIQQSNQGSKASTPQPPSAPKAMQQQQQQQQNQVPDFLKQMNQAVGSMHPQMGMNPMMNMGNMAMNMNPMMMNPMMMGMPMNMGMPINGMNGMNGMGGMGGMGNPQMGFQNQQMGRGNGRWQNQQNFGGGGMGDNGAYMRNPINPHRQRGRQSRPRSVDYKQMGQ